jgi:hypothetical protein
MKCAKLPLILVIGAALESRWLRSFEFRVILLGRAATVLALAALLLTTGGAHAAEPSSPLTGRWRAAETADERQQRLEAIDEATAHFGGFRRGKARDMLAERTSPPQSLTIEIEGSTVTIGSADHELELELGAAPIEASGDQGKAQLSARMEGEQLIVVADGGKGGRTTAYRADEDAMSVEVTMTGANLAAPLTYVATYVRAE